jgi:chorismate mutase / prephenate dehydratase
MTRRAARGGSGTADGGSAELRRLRNRIDGVDRRIVGLLNERAELTRAVGEEKNRLGIPIRDAGREREVLLRVSMANAGPIPQADLLAIYRRLIASARGLEGRGVRGPVVEGEPPGH